MLMDSMPPHTILVEPLNLAIVVIFIGLLAMLVGFNTFNFIAMAIGVMIMGIGFWRLALKVEQYAHRQ